MMNHLNENNGAFLYTKLIMKLLLFACFVHRIIY